MWKNCIYGLLSLVLFFSPVSVIKPVWAEENTAKGSSELMTPETLALVRKLVDSDPKKALDIIQKILNKNTVSVSPQNIITLMAYQSAALARIGNFKLGLDIGRGALTRAEEDKVNRRTIAYIHNAIGRNLEGLGQMPGAMKSFQNAHETFLLLGDESGMATSKLNVAGLFVSASLYSRAITEYEQALALLDPDDDIFLYVRTLNNMGFSLIEEGAPDKALEYLAQAREMAHVMENELVIAYTYENSGEAAYHSGLIQQAEEHLLFSLKLALKNQIEPLTTVIYYFMGRVELSRGDFVKSKKYAEMALAIAEKNKDVAKLVNIYDLLSILARQRQDYKAAIEYRDLNIHNKETVASDKTVVALSLLQTEYQAKERQQQIRLLQRDNEIQQLSLQKERNLRYLGYGLVLILCFGVGFLLYALRIKSMATALAISREKDQLELKLAAEAANRAKSEFLSYMSHELRTPLNAVIGFSETLRLKLFGDLTKKQEEFVNYIHEGGELLLKLINDLLHLSKIETGAVDLDLKHCDLSEIVRDVIPMIEHLIKKNDIQIHESDIPQMTRAVIVDRARMEQILVNLISNAVKYGRKGGNVWLSISEVEKDIQRVSVRDDGIGIAEDQFENVYTPFNRAGMEQSGIEGTGAGLSIVKALVEAMGGEIGFKSQLGDGTTFWIDLPIMEKGASIIDQAPIKSS